MTISNYRQDLFFGGDFCEVLICFCRLFVHHGMPLRLVESSRQSALTFLVSHLPEFARLVQICARLSPRSGKNPNPPPLAPTLSSSPFLFLQFFLPVPPSSRCFSCTDHRRLPLITGAYGGFFPDESWHYMADLTGHQHKDPSVCPPPSPPPPAPIPPIALLSIGLPRLLFPHNGISGVIPPLLFKWATQAIHWRWTLNAGRGREDGKKKEERRRDDERTRGGGGNKRDGGKDVGLFLEEEREEKSDLLPELTTRA